MQVELFEIKRYNDNYRQQVLSLWEKSVQATHHFLTRTDFEDIRQIVSTIDFNSLHVFCLLKQNSVAGFIGVADTKIEMLFLDPDYTGLGLGKKLMRFAITELDADEVEVNEQNLQAVEFYKKLGFVVYERTAKDNQGKDYPILKMKLKLNQ